MPILNHHRREILEYLRQHDLVKHIKHDYYHITVTFTTGIKEKWQINPGRPARFEYKFPSDSDLLGKELKTYREFELNPLDPEYEKTKHCFLIHKADIKKAGFINTRLKVHELITDLIEEGWVEPYYIDDALYEDYKRVKDFSLTRHKIGPATLAMYYNVDRKGGGGVYIGMHFLDWGDIKEGYRHTPRHGWSQPKTLLRAIDMLIKLRKDITRGRMIRRMCVYKGDRIAGPRLIPASFFKTILMDTFKDIKNPVVLDMQPSILNTAIATAICRGTYISSLDLSDFGKFAGIETIVDDGKCHADIAFLSNARYQEVDDIIEGVARLKSRADNIVAFVAKPDRDILFNKLKPKRSVIVYLNVKKYDPTGYMFIY